MVDLGLPSPGDLPDPGIKPGSPALQADSLPAELCGKPKILVGAVNCDLNGQSIITAFTALFYSVSAVVVLLEMQKLEFIKNSIGAGGNSSSLESEQDNL